MSKPKQRPQSTISHDPYAFIAGGGQGKPIEDEAPKQDRPAKAVTETGETEKITTPFPKELIERVRNAAYWDRLTLTGIIVQAVSEALDRMEQERGDPYPPRKNELKGGRPIGSGKARNA